MPAERCRAEKAAAEARAIGFREHAERWLAMVRQQPNRSGKMRAAGTIRSYWSKVDGYLEPEFGDTPVRHIDDARIQKLKVRLDAIPAVANLRSPNNGVNRPVLMVLMMILRQAVRDGIIAAVPNVSIPQQKPVRHGLGYPPGEDVLEPQQVEELWRATPAPHAIAILLARLSGRAARVRRYGPRVSVPGGTGPRSQPWPGDVPRRRVSGSHDGLGGSGLAAGLRRRCAAVARCAKGPTTVRAPKS